MMKMKILLKIIKTTKRRKRGRERGRIISNKMRQQMQLVHLQQMNLLSNRMETNQWHKALEWRWLIKRGMNCSLIVTRVKMRVSKTIKLAVIILFMLERSWLRGIWLFKNLAGVISLQSGLHVIYCTIHMLHWRYKKVQKIILKLLMMKLKFLMLLLKTLKTLNGSNL
jgi:hypothetical protein